LSRLLLVRHAQASFLEPDYDKLSPLGETQARLLGEYWAGEHLAFHCAGTGPRTRQKDTANIVAEAYRRAGLSFPHPTVMLEFDEFDGEGLLSRALPGLLESNEQVRDLYWSFKASCLENRSRNFRRFFEAFVSAWMSGNSLFACVESWPEFCSRVNDGLSRLISDCGHGVSATVFCSGGPIAVAAQRALHLAPADALRIMGVCRNCSIAEFLFSGDRFTLSTFNELPHLADPALLTYC
jgi:broad specificity phosphatase PhoE